MLRSRWAHLSIPRIAWRSRSAKRRPPARTAPPMGRWPSSRGTCCPLRRGTDHRAGAGDRDCELDHPDQRWTPGAIGLSRTIFWPPRKPAVAVTERRRGPMICCCGLGGGWAMTRLPAEPLRLDRLIRAGGIHSMAGERYRSVGVRGAEIVAVSAEPGGLDDLAGRATVVVDAGDLTVLPAFADAHEHLMEASRNTLLVPVDRATSVAEFTGMVAAAARDAAAGEWIVTSMAWHESNLAENRLPTGAELDAAAPGHPVLARRGGHLAIANTAALAAAGVGAGAPDPPGGKFGRLPDGRLSGLLEGGAVYQVAAFAPTPKRADLVEALRRGSAAYAALGVGTIREAMITLEELLAYQDAAERGLLSVRVRPLIRVGAEL